MEQLSIENILDLAQVSTKEWQKLLRRPGP